MSELKKGRISKEEDLIIQGNLDMPIEELATRLNRNVESLAEYIKKKHGAVRSLKVLDRYTLVDRPFYRELKKQFSGEELELFKYYWDNMVSQFNKDVFATEEIQILDVCKLEILMNRCLITSNTNIQLVSSLENRLREFETLISPDMQEQEMAMGWERQLSVLRSSQESLTRELRELLTKKAGMLKDMKATREQRIKRLEDSRESFPAWVSNMMQNPDIVKKYGLEMEKMRLATIKEKKRLSAYHKYEDGMIDQPFLNVDTILSEDDKHGTS